MVLTLAAPEIVSKKNYHKAQQKGKQKRVIFKVFFTKYLVTEHNILFSDQNIGSEEKTACIRLYEADFLMLS